MNERIDKLAREAGFQHPDHIGLCEEYAYFDHVRFAELIVRECAGIIESQDVDPSFKLRISWAVKKHFGIGK